MSAESDIDALDWQALQGRRIGEPSRPEGQLSSDLETRNAWEYFSELGETIERRWEVLDADVAAFPEVATSTLAEIEPPNINALDLLADVATRRRLPVQEDKEARFAEPPLTLWRGRGFYVSALCWLNGSTSIHQHSFSGAFRVVQGSSLHVPYKFDTDRRVTERLSLGQLHQQSPETLKRGDVRPILSGDKFIHSLFHLERPSVTIVVRTYGERTATPQFMYMRPGVAFDPFYDDSTIKRRLQSLSSLYALDRAKAATTARSYIAEEDVWTGFVLLKHWFYKFEKGDQFTTLLESFTSRHSVFVSFAEQMFSYGKLEHSIMARREMLTARNHRLLLALLLNLANQKDIFSVLAALFPGEPPGALIATWLSELAAPALRGISGFKFHDGKLEQLVESLRQGNMDEFNSLGFAMKDNDILTGLFNR